VEQGGEVDGGAVQAGYEQDSPKDSFYSCQLFQDQPEDAAVPHKDSAEGQAEGSGEKALTPRGICGFEGGWRGMTWTLQWFGAFGALWRFSGSARSVFGFG